MLRLTLAQMRRTLPRLVAVGIAIALSTGFITATFLATSTISATTYDAAAMLVADADIIVGSNTEPISAEDLANLNEVDGVAAVQPLDFETRVVASSDGSEVVAVTSPAADPSLDRTSLLSGSPPAAANEIALPESTIERLEVEVGDSVTSSGYITAGNAQPEQTMTLVGITADGSGLGFGIPIALASTADLDAWRAAQGVTTYYGVLVAVDGDTAQALSAIEQALPNATVQTGDEYAEQQARQFTGGVSVLLAMVLSFAAVAIAVAGLVISNTFQVLVAQRTQTLALLRCVGATRRQVRTSVRLEALLLGVGASILGILGGIGLGQLVLTLLGNANQGVPLPSVVPVSIWAVAVPLVVGILVTLIAAGGAARAATRVAPLAALRPVEIAAGGSRRRRGARVVFGWVLVGLGLAGMAGAMAYTSAADETTFLLALAVGIASGILALVGTVMCSITFVPAIVRGLGQITAGLGAVPGRLAAVNAVRNPARTASTANALLVGVALVTMMSTGATTARAQFDSMLQSQYSVDVTVTSPTGSPLSADTLAAVQGVEGVETSIVMDSAESEITIGAEPGWATILHVPDAAAFLAVVRESPDTWERGTVFADGWITDGQGEDTVRIGNMAAPAYLVDGLPDYSIAVDSDQWAAAGLTADSSTVWLRLADDADVRTVVGEIQNAVSETSMGAASTPQVSGGAVERAGYAQIIDTLLLVVIGLLGVAVVIALLGVANTLSLSVVERRQENALLRALGLTRGQLRMTLAWEGILLALVGAVVGIALGLTFGWVGSYLLLSGPSGGASIPLIIPWSTLGIVLLVALAAGVLASVLPARNAVKVPPVVALGA